ncbi:MULTISPECIES: hypothetical protein [Paenibacillus]|uniref:hypothetical protein n=1 Tax=Paenibacillus TaxID=44249 RepID=UPI0016430050|nr:hypothetical protein [Paenibacillus sp. Y412MC10]
MWMAVGLISFVAWVVLLVLGIIARFKKSGKAKKWLYSALACFAIMIIAVFADPDTQTETANEKENSTAKTETVTAKADDAAKTEEDKQKVDQEAKEAADKKAQEEQKAKEEAEAKAKADAEAKAKAEAEAKQKTAEEAKAKVEAEKSKIATAMSLIVPNIAENQEMNDKTYDYIVKHSNLFPATSPEAKQAAKDAADPNVTSRHLFKNITPYLATMYSVSGYVVQINEEETDIGTVAQVHILDDNGNSLIGIYFGSTGDILEGDQIRMRGVPTASYSFPNVGGGTTNAILLTLSTIQKL